MNTSLILIGNSLTHKPGIALIVLHRQTEEVLLEPAHRIRLRLHRQRAFHLLMTPRHTRRILNELDQRGGPFLGLKGLDKLISHAQTKARLIQIEP